MKDNFFQGIGSYWHQFFQDRGILESFGTASTEMLSSVYAELSNLVLSLGHEDVPVYDRFKWDALVLKASDVEIVDSRYRFPLPQLFNTKGLRRSPVLLSHISTPKILLSQNHDFTIGDGFIDFNLNPFGLPDVPIREVGGELQIMLWCPTAEVDTNRIWHNYGHFTGGWNYSSQAYKDLVRGLLHTWMHGPIVNRMESGLNLVAGLPVAYGNGNEVVVAIIDLGDRRIVRTTQRDYSVPADVSVRVNVGDRLGLFQAITDVVKVVDYLIEPGWWQGSVDSLPPEIGNTGDLNKAFEQYLKYNTFLVKINIAPFLSAIGDGKTPFSAEKLKQFIFRFKPSYTYPLVVFSLDLLSSLELSDYLRESIIVPALDIYTRPKCYKFGFGSDEDLFLYYFDRTVTHFDGTIKVFTSFKNHDPVPLLHFDQPLVRFDKDALSLSFGGTMLFNAYDWTAITFSGCEEDRLTAASTVMPVDVVDHLPPLFNENFGFNGQIMWGHSEIPFCDAPGYTVRVENREDIVTSEESLVIMDYTGKSQLYRLFNGEWRWDNAAIFNAGPLFGGSGLLFDNQNLHFSELPQMAFDGSESFGNVQKIRFDSGYEQQVNVPAVMSHHDQHPYTQFLFDGGHPFDGSEHRMFSDDRSQYDYTRNEVLSSYSDLADEINEFVAEVSAATLNDRHVKMFDGEHLWNDAVLFAAGPLFNRSDISFNLSTQFGGIAGSAFDGNSVFGGGSGNVFDSDYGSSAETRLVVSCDDVLPNQDITFGGIDTFGGMEVMRFGADRAVYDGTARELERSLEEAIGVPDESLESFQDVAFEEQLLRMFNGADTWGVARLFSSGPLFGENGLRFQSAIPFGGLPDFSFGGSDTFADLHPSRFDSCHEDTLSISVYSISEGRIVETLS
jgi:hypothetical protein